MWLSPSFSSAIIPKKTELDHYTLLVLSQWEQNRIRTKTQDIDESGGDYL